MHGLRLALPFFVVFSAAGLAQQPDGPPRFDVWSVAFSPDGKTMAAGGGYANTPGEVGIWDLATKKPLHRFAEERGVGSVAFSPDGTLLASSTWKGSARTGYVRVRDWRAAKEVATLEVLGIFRIAFSPKGDLLGMAAERKTVFLWDFAKKKFPKELEGDLLRFHCVQFSPDGRYLLAGGGDLPNGKVNLVVVWDVATGQQVKTLAGHTNSIIRMSFSPDGKTLATASADQTIRLWDWDTGATRKILSGHNHWVEDVAFSADGKTLLSCSHDHTIRLWDWENGKQTGQIDAMTDSVRVAQFTPDQRAIVAAGANKTLKLFDAATHQETAALWNGAQERKVAMDEIPAIDALAAAVDGPKGEAGGASWRTRSVVALIVLLVVAMLLGLVWKRQKGGTP
jgi:tricorn protease-like protein